MLRSKRINKKLKKIILLSGISLIILIILISFLIIRNKSKNSRLPSQPQNQINNLKTQLNLSNIPTQVPTSNNIKSGKVSNNIYTNNEYKFSFRIPTGWVFQSEEKNVGGDLLRVSLTAPGFKEGDILSISVTDKTYDQQYQYMDWNVSKESEEKITIAGKQSSKRIGTHEFGGYLIVVIVPNGNNTIELILRTNAEPYTSQYQTLLDSFKFIN